MNLTDEPTPMLFPDSSESVHETHEFESVKAIQKAPLFVSSPVAPLPRESVDPLGFKVLS